MQRRSDDLDLPLPTFGQSASGAIAADAAITAITAIDAIVPVGGVAAGVRPPAAAAGVLA